MRFLVVALAFLPALIPIRGAADDVQRWRLIATDPDTGSAVFQADDSDRLLLVRAGQPIGDSGFRLQYSRRDGANLELIRRYQGQSLVQTLAIGAALDPKKIAEIEEADRRAQAAMGHSSTVIEPDPK
jgi:hypothetical protein